MESKRSLLPQRKEYQAHEHMAEESGHQTYHYNHPENCTHEKCVKETLTNTSSSNC